LVVTINGVGLVFEFVYLTIFYVYAKKQGRVRILTLDVSSVLFNIVIFMNKRHILSKTTVK
jgi:solute carrier family 50 protein (sugar transporter)